MGKRNVLARDIAILENARTEALREAEEFAQEIRVSKKAKRKKGKAKIKGSINAARNSSGSDYPDQFDQLIRTLEPPPTEKKRRGYRRLPLAFFLEGPKEGELPL